MNKEIGESVAKEIGSMIRQARKEKGLTQSKLGELLGVSKVTVAHYESGKQNFTIDTLDRIAKALELKFTGKFAK